MTHCNEMEERIAEFKTDPQKMEVTNKFVAEVIEKAKEEAAKRMKNTESVQQQDSDAGSRRRAPWQARARGFISRIVAICFCNNDSKA